MKQITQKEINLLVNKGIIKNTHKGFVSKNGFEIGFYKTRHKRYLEDKYVDIAKGYLSKE